MRPRDINLEIGCGLAGESNYYGFQEGCYNTFDQRIADDVVAKKISRLQSVTAIKKMPLSVILNTYLQHNRSIDLLSIDCEILLTNDWIKYRSAYICTESHTTDASRPMNPQTIFESHGYSLIAQTEFSSIYHSARRI